MAAKQVTLDDLINTLDPEIKQLLKEDTRQVLDKRPTMFPSVALHESNWLEVCFYGNSCHTNLHNKTITWELLHDSAEWKVIVGKFKKERIYGHVSLEKTERSELAALAAGVL